MKNKSFWLMGSMMVAFAVLFVWVVNRDATPNLARYSSTNVLQESDTQVIKILAQSGYEPKLTLAKAGVPTTLRFETKGTYDCSLALSIPALDFRKTLDPAGVTEVKITADQAQGRLKFSCSMGMYWGEIFFQE